MSMIYIYLGQYITGYIAYNVYKTLLCVDVIVKIIIIYLIHNRKISTSFY